MYVIPPWSKSNVYLYNGERRTNMLELMNPKELIETEGGQYPIIYILPVEPTPYGKPVTI